MDEKDLQEQISHRLSGLDQGIEVIAVEATGADRLRVYIDHPGGVDLALCERSTRELADLLTRWSLEVSSPGSDRPLTKPDHFRRFTGRKARVKTVDDIEGRHGFTGRIASASEEAVELELTDGSVTIPIDNIRRSHLVPEAA